jgi:hypothetical protein
VFNQITCVLKKVVGVFVRFRAPFEEHIQSFAATVVSKAHIKKHKSEIVTLGKKATKMRTCQDSEKISLAGV